MRLLRTRDELLDARVRVADESGDVAAVLTMGALHAGHRGLVDEARRRVGPSGTCRAHDLPSTRCSSGPARTWTATHGPSDADLATAEQAGVDLVFAPNVEQVYPDGAAARCTVDPGPLGTRCWRARLDPATSRRADGRRASC